MVNMDGTAVTTRVLSILTPDTLYEYPLARVKGAVHNCCITEGHMREITSINQSRLLTCVLNDHIKIPQSNNKRPQVYIVYSRLSDFKNIWSLEY